MRFFALSIVLILAIVPGTLSCQRAPNTEADTAAVTAVMDAFYGAMKSADSELAMAQIADDAVFLEGGRLETREQYETNHLPADIEFETAVPGKRSSMSVAVDRDAAWVIATTEYHGEFEESPVDFVSAQLMLLTRHETGWKIRTIH